jgi:NAD(P)-dependent dehydrogenase (short-subunit alcohol dehydrogenase family)
MPHLPLSLEGRVALVTGSARGIGKAIADTLASHGAEVVVADMRIELAEETAKEIAQNTGVKTKAINVNVSDPTSVNEMVDKVLAEMGHVDILVNNAGVTRDNLIMRMSDVIGLCP